MNPRLAFLALSDSLHGRSLLSGLLKNGFAPGVMFVCSENALRKYSRNRRRYFWRKYGAVQFAWRVLFTRTVLRKIDAETLRLDPALVEPITEMARRAGIEIKRFDNINGAESRRLLEEAAPDYLILGGAPLLKAPVLAIPKLGTINTHPGIVPYARGVDVVFHSVADGLPVGVTTMFVDEGVDSGAILGVYPVEAVLGDDLIALAARVEITVGKCLTETLEELIQRSLTPREQTENYPLYGPITLAEYRKAQRKMRDLKVSNSHQSSVINQ